jgi:hypothetical protein
MDRQHGHNAAFTVPRFPYPRMTTASPVPLSPGLVPIRRPDDRQCSNSPQSRTAITTAIAITTSSRVTRSKCSFRNCRLFSRPGLARQ